MNRTFTLSLAAAVVLLASAASAHAALSVDTGTPNGNAVGAFAFDSNDFYAGQITFTDVTTIQEISTHVLNGATGETFTIALYDDSAAHLPGTALYSATATVDANGLNGWSGVSGLTGWNVQAGSYWVGLEIGSIDTVGMASPTGALLDRGVAMPLAQTSFNSGSAYQATAGLDFGLRVSSVPAVPEPSETLLMLAGLVALASVVRKRLK